VEIYDHSHIGWLQLCIVLVLTLPHLNRTAPIWDELGAKYKDNANVVIAKMDSTANEVDVPGLSVKGFPTLYFFKGSDKSHPVKYEEGRELKDLVSFLEKNSQHAAAHEEL
jgi:protein disulfide-isomerase A1